MVLPRAARADQRHHLAGPHFQLNASQAEPVGRVLIVEADVIQHDAACWNLPSFAAFGLLDDLLIAIQIFEDFLRRAQSLLEDIVDAGEALHRLIEHQQGEDEAGELARGQRAALDLDARVAEQGDDGDRAEAFDERRGEACWAM